MPHLTPCRFFFDDGAEYEGFAHGTTWNGWDNVSVTPLVRCQIVAHYLAQDPAAAEYMDELAAQPVGNDGLIDLSNGWTALIAERHGESVDELAERFRAWLREPEQAPLREIHGDADEIALHVGEMALDTDLGAEERKLWGATVDQAHVWQAWLMDFISRWDATPASAR